MYQRSYFFTVHHLLEVSEDVHIEDIDRQVVLHAHCCCCDVHHLQTACYYLFVCDVMELCCGRVFLRICCLDAVNACALQHYICLYLDAT